MNISIGLILPSSTICRMAKDFEKGFVQEVTHLLEGSGYEVEYIKEFVGNGNKDMLSAALDKFFGYDQVDIVTGILSNYSLKNVVQKFERFKVPLLCSNLGEHMISTEIKNPYVYINSFHFWQQAWLLGYYTAKHIGINGTVVSALYDSGYIFLAAFLNGMQTADKNACLALNIIPMPAKGELSRIEATMDRINVKDFDFVFPLFCGEEANLFLKEFKKRNWGNEVELVGLPFLLEETPEDLSGISMYSVVHSKEEGKSDIAYKKVFERLGKLAGRGIGTAIIKGKGKIKVNEINDSLKEMDSSKLYASNETPMLLDPISIMKIDIIEGNQIVSVPVLEQSVLFEDNEEFLKSGDSQIASWLNPYLGI